MFRLDRNLGIFPPQVYRSMYRAVEVGMESFMSHHNPTEALMCFDNSATSCVKDLTFSDITKTYFSPT